MTGAAALPRSPQFSGIKRAALWMLSTVGTVAVVVLSAMAALVLAFGVFALGLLAFTALWAKSKLRKTRRTQADNGIILDAHETPQGWKVSI